MHMTNDFLFLKLEFHILCLCMKFYKVKVYMYKRDIISNQSQTHLKCHLLLVSWVQQMTCWLYYEINVFVTKKSTLLKLKIKQVYYFMDDCSSLKFIKCDLKIEVIKIVNKLFWYCCSILYIWFLYLFTTCTKLNKIFLKMYIDAFQGHKRTLSAERLWYFK